MLLELLSDVLPWVLRLAINEPLLLSYFSSRGGTVDVLGVLLREDRLLLLFLASRVASAFCAFFDCA